jgi:hypothetical protein
MLQLLTLGTLTLRTLTLGTLTLGTLTLGTLTLGTLSFDIGEEDHFVNVVFDLDDFENAFTKAKANPIDK